MEKTLYLLSKLNIKDDNEVAILLQQLMFDIKILVKSNLIKINENDIFRQAEAMQYSLFKIHQQSPHFFSDKKLLEKIEELSSLPNINPEYQSNLSELWQGINDQINLYNNNKKIENYKNQLLNYHKNVILNKIEDFSVKVEEDIKSKIIKESAALINLFKSLDIRKISDEIILKKIITKDNKNNDPMAFLNTISQEIKTEAHDQNNKILMLPMLAAIEEIKTLYCELGRKDNLIQIQNLERWINKNIEKLTLQKLAIKIEHLLINERNSFTGDAQSFYEKLNDMSAKNYHYPRMLACLLKQSYQEENIIFNDDIKQKLGNYIPDNIVDYRFRYINTFSLQQNKDLFNIKIEAKKNEITNLEKNSPNKILDQAFVDLLMLKLNQISNKISREKHGKEAFKKLMNKINNINAKITLNAEDKFYQMMKLIEIDYNNAPPTINKIPFLSSAKENFYRINLLAIKEDAVIKKHFELLSKKFSKKYTR